MAERNLRSDRFLRALDEYSKVVIITHDTPDPDAIASGWALLSLAGELLKKPVRLIGGGAIVRAENVYMVQLLKPPIELVDHFVPDDETAAVLVDCSAEGANQLLGNGSAKPVAVIDHHKPQGRRVRVRFRDIRPRFAASATIVASYLREQGVQPSKELATALMYAVRTEVIGTPVRFTRSERSIVTWLSSHVDHQILERIENASLKHEYFEDLILAICGTFVYGDVAVSFLYSAHSPEIVGEVADLLIRYEAVKRVLCGAVVGRDLVCSARTREGGGDAVALLRSTLKGLGNCGGHPNRAGGKIHSEAKEGSPGPGITKEMIDEVKARWLKACEADGSRGVRLVARREIVDVL